MDKFKKYFIFLMLISFLFSCAAHKETAVGKHIPPPLPGSILQDFDADPQPAELSIKRKIITQQAVKTLGVPYRWGGHSPETGFDCSGLVAYTHKKAHLTIPRTAKAQYDNGKPVHGKTLQAADLVFFKNLDIKGFHVGIYIGDGRFIHAPGKGRPVAYEYLNNPYFIKHYIGSRSYL